MVIHGHGFLLGQKIGMLARIIATGAIYQKVGRGYRGGGREGGEKEGKREGGREVEWEGEGQFTKVDLLMVLVVFTGIEVD